MVDVTYYQGSLSKVKTQKAILTDKSLRDVVLDFVKAGRDTTATTLSRAIHTVMTPNHVAEKPYSELKTFEEDRGRKRMFSCFR
jgi:cytochrome P450